MKIYLGIKKWVIIATVGIILAIIIGIPLGRYIAKPAVITVEEPKCADGAAVVSYDKNGGPYTCSSTLETIEVKQMANSIVIICHCNKKD